MQLAWFQRDGKVVANVGPPQDYADVQITPDDRHAFVTRTDAKTSGGNIWTLDVTTGESAPLTFDPVIPAQPVVSPDGREIVFRSNRAVPAPLFRRLVSGAGGEEMLMDVGALGVPAGGAGGNLFPSDWSPDPDDDIVRSRRTGSALRDPRVEFRQSISNQLRGVAGRPAIPLQQRRRECDAAINHRCGELAGVAEEVNLGLVGLVGLVGWVGR